MRILIVDDEAPARFRLRALIEEIQAGEIVAEASNGIQGLALNDELQPDIILLDIRMPGMDGLEMARHLSILDHPPAVIFTTAYSEHALDAFERHAIDYLVKPIRRERLINALGKAGRPNRAHLEQLGLSQPGSERSHISIRTHGKIQLIPIDQIIYLQADQKYTTLRTSEKQLLIDESLKSLEEEFTSHFVRLHRNALVAKKFLAGIEKTSNGRYEANLRGIPERLEVSRRHLPALRKMLK